MFYMGSPLKTKGKVGKTMRPVSGLTVIEYPYCYNAWDVELSGGKLVFHSEIKKLMHRETCFYHESGVFHTMGVPVTVKEIDYQMYQQYPPYEGVTRNISDDVCFALQKGDAVLFPGGYCNSAPAIVGGIQRAIDKDKIIGVIWIDAHADCRIPGQSAVSPTRLVSVPMSTLTGIADSTLLDYRKKVCGLQIPCRGENVIASDIRILDEETGHNLITAGILKLDASEFASEDTWRGAVEALAERVDAIYVSIDADILKHRYIPSYSKNVPYGQELDTVARNAAIATETGKVCALSLFCFNFDLDSKDAAQTYQSAITIMGSALKSWRCMPM